MGTFIAQQHDAALLSCIFEHADLYEGLFFFMHNIVVRNVYCETLWGELRFVSCNVVQLCYFVHLCDVVYPCMWCTHV